MKVKVPGMHKKCISKMQVHQKCISRMQVRCWYILDTKKKNLPASATQLLLDLGSEDVRNEFLRCEDVKI